jgi:acyl-coenzyme A thioesterase PaaI-like protein
MALQMRREFPPVRKTGRHDALETLTASVRRLVEATVATGHGPDELRAIAAEVDALADRLADRIDDDPWPRRSYGAGITDPPSLMAINPAIGRCNPTAPVVELHIGEDKSVAGTVHFGLAHVGPPYRAHGGVIASVLDQLLGITTIVSGSPGMTSSMTVTYRRATPIRRDLRMDAHFAGVDGRHSQAVGAIYDEQGRVAAEAEATFTVPRTSL